MGKLLALVQPAKGFPHRFLRGFLQILSPVAVHVHLAHITGDSGLFQLLHQNQRGFPVERGKHTHLGGSVSDQLQCQSAILLPGVMFIGKAGLRGESVGIQPFQQGQIHAGPQHGVLGSVEMKVREGLGNQAVSKILHRCAGVPLRQLVEHAGKHAPLQHKIAGRVNLQLAKGRGGDKDAFYNRGHKIASFPKSPAERKERPSALPRSGHS
ncbi:hypothetical protein SDC9_124747 [bioreactor metagenome]|uniref:Uncharacterized protein n=1 Tax=bioreactor metagenome TaxID=1076179 RepID=A0A645CLE3_9ZZZZ